jgi:hypothetical protein
MTMHGRKIELLDTPEGTAFRFTLDRGRKPERHSDNPDMLPSGDTPAEKEEK